MREVRELLVQSVVQLLKSHWAGAGAGWHALFMFFSKAGKDPALQVAELALTALEPVPVELFRSIPAECFADCVNCFAVFAQHTQHLHLRFVLPAGGGGKGGGGGDVGAGRISVCFFKRVECQFYAWWLWVLVSDDGCVLFKA